MLWTNATSSLTVGWSVGGTVPPGTTNKMRVLMAGLTPSGGSAGTIELPGFTLTTGVHSLAWCLKSGATSFHYSYDGSIQTAITVSGTFLPSTNAGSHYIGRWAGASFAGSFASLAWLQAFNADLSDGDLNTLSGSPSTYVPPNISTAPVFNWQSRWCLDAPVSVVGVGTQAGRLQGTGSVAIAKTLR